MIDSVTFYQDDKDESYLFVGKKTTMEVKIISKSKFENVIIGFSLKTVDGIVVLNDSTFFMKDLQLPLEVGMNTFVFEFNSNVANLEYYFFMGLITFETGERVDLDQRWRMKKVKFFSDRDCGEGLVYAPSILKLNN